MASQNPTLGRLGLLPPELRLQVYSYVLPDTYKQTFTFEGDHNRLDPYSSRPLDILYTSKAIRHETTEALTSNSVCAISIDKDKFSTNFPFCDRFMSYFQRNNVVKLAASKGLHITVEGPHSRSAPGLAHVRHNVRLVVNLLNAGDRNLPLPGASLNSKHHKSLTYTYNNYAMLLGPLARLANAKRGYNITCTSPLTPGFMDPKCLEQGNLIAAATQDAVACAAYPVQQKMLDLKLALALQQDSQVIENMMNPGRPAQPIGFPCATKMLEAMEELAQLSERGVSLRDGAVAAGAQEWCVELHTMLTSKRGWAVLEPDWVKRILVAYPPRDYIWWSAGHQTLHNPFWQ